MKIIQASKDNVTKWRTAPLAWFMRAASIGLMVTGLYSVVSTMATRQ